MRIIPVLDLMNGVVVRGVAGRRSEYRPLVSTLTPSCHPVDVAAAVAERFGLHEFYVADLDAIAGAGPAWETIAALHAKSFRLWLDAGIVSAADALRLAKNGVATIVAGLETIADPQTLRELVEMLGERIVFSLDLRGGVPLGNRAHWKTTDAESVAVQAIALGVRRVLVLDLTRVGVGEGTGTEALCFRLVQRFPHVEISAGGGVRGVEDLHRLRNAGVQNVLVASALHDGRLTPKDL